MLGKLGSLAARKKWWFIGGWLVIFAGVLVAAIALPHETRDNFDIPGTESQDAQNLLLTDFPSFANASVTVVFQAPNNGDLTTAPYSTAVGTAITDISKVDGVASAPNPLTSPYDAFYLSSDKSIAYTTVTFDTTVQNVTNTEFHAVQSATAPATQAGINVQYSGQLADLYDPVPPGISKYADDIGLALAALILLISFGSVVAMGLPLGTAIGALLVSATSLAVLEHFFTIGSINPIFGTMLGLGVGVDYSLLVLNRYLQDRAQGIDVHTAAGRAVNTAGRAVLFAGITISIAVVALIVFGVPYLTTLGFTSAMYVGVTVLAALTLLPALIGLAGRHIESLRLPFIKRRSEVDPLDPNAFWARWSRIAVRHRRILVPVGLLILVTIAVPFRSAHLGFVGDGQDPTSSTERQAYDLITQGFGVGRNGQIFVAVSLPGSSTSAESSDQAAVTDLVKAIQSTDDVDQAVGPITNSAGTAAVVEVVPKTSPSSDQTQQLVKDLRATVIPNTLSGTSLSASDVYVGGETAVLIDLTARINTRLPVFIGAVLIVAFLLLLIVFRSLVVPLVSIILNLLMFLAAYGLIVAVFQWGWGNGVIGLDQTVPIESFIPMVVFAVLFGLSTDYQVFLLSRMREAYDATGDPEQAVVAGLTTTARVIASAVLIMAAVFLSFVTNPGVVVKMIGLPLGLAILLDAFILRLTVMPGLMRLFGKAGWYLPHWLGRILPRISIDPTD